MHSSFKQVFISLKNISDLKLLNGSVFKIHSLLCTIKQWNVSFHNLSSNCKTCPTPETTSLSCWHLISSMGSVIIQSNSAVFQEERSPPFTVQTQITLVQLERVYLMILYFAGQTVKHRLWLIILAMLSGVYILIILFQSNSVVSIKTPLWFWVGRWLVSHNS